MNAILHKEDAQQRILNTSSHSKDPVPRKVGELPLSTVGSGYFQVLWSHSLHICLKFSEFQLQFLFVVFICILFVIVFCV